MLIQVSKRTMYEAYLAFIKTHLIYHSKKTWILVTKQSQV